MPLQTTDKKTAESDVDTKTLLEETDFQLVVIKNKQLFCYL